LEKAARTNPMKCYQEITLLPGYDISLSFIWSKVYQQLHLCLVEQQVDYGNVPYGVSFPQYRREDKKPLLGEKIRVFANSEEELARLELKKKVERLLDYVHTTGIRAAPEKVAGYSTYRRVRQENSADSKARRFLTRHKNMEYDQAVAMFSRKKRSFCDFPYVQLKSLTNNNQFRLYIEKKPCAGETYDGFGTYGLSHTSTVPEF